MERVLRGIAGAMVLISVLLTHYVHPAWMWFTVFIGVNMLQSSFTNWCPMMNILKKCGVK